MKKCPFCAEEIQDAAIKCRYCGTMLTEASPSPVQVLVPLPSAAFDEEIKRLLDANKITDAIKLLRERKPTLGRAASVAYFKAVQKGTDPEQPVLAVPASKPFWPRVILWIGIFFVLLLSIRLILIIVLDPASSNAPTERQPAAPLPSANDNQKTATATLVATTDWSDPSVISHLCKDSDGTQLTPEIKSRCIGAHLALTRTFLGEGKVPEARQAFSLALFAGVTQAERADVETQLHKALDEEGKKLATRSQAQRDAQSAWLYDESIDKMGRNMKRAYVLSQNLVEFDFPYNGPQQATLTLRVHASYGRDVMLSIERGQFLCGIDSCTVGVRFDDGKPQHYSVGQPADHSTTTLFIHSYDRFVASARKAKRVAIEAPFFQQGRQVFEFDIQNLKW